MKNDLENIENIIHQAFTDPLKKISPETKKIVELLLTKLNTGELRVAEKINHTWVTHQWIKKGILLSFRLFQNKMISAGFTHFFDKINLKYANWNDSMTDFEKNNIRVVPGAIARTGTYIGQNTILMPCYINIGAYIGSGCMIDTWATVGSCAQIGHNVHLSGGVGIGGVLEPLQANPTIIEDNCFIGARSEIVEGVIIEEGAVISMGVYLSQSTRIYNRMTGEITYGRVPKNAVVVSGTLPASDQSHSLYCAVIVKIVDQKTREKTALNQLLRDIDG